MAQPRLADYAMLFFLGLVWGSSFLFIGVAVKSIPPLTLAALRCLIGALVLLAAARVMGHAIPRDPRAWLSYLAMGLTNSAIPFILITLGQTRIESGLAAILIATVPIFTLALAHWFTEDKTTPRKAVGTLLGFAGIVLLVGPAALAGVTSGLVGQLLVVGGALCFAITQVLVKRHRGGTPVVNAACSLACSALWTVPFAFAVEQPWHAAPALIGAGALLALGILSTGISHLVFFLLIRSTGPSFVTLNNFIAPPVGLAWGILLLGENPPWTAYAALAVILAGIAVATRRPRPRSAPAPAEAL
ncbi:MAG TPA: EamA family transporter [Alphaproteobacteria bacterium]|jgi:drug/metabolite transporter (DMT)-like permease